jgi:hypothetical protein
MQNIVRRRSHDTEKRYIVEMVVLWWILGSIGYLLSHLLSLLFLLGWFGFLHFLWHVSSQVLDRRSALCFLFSYVRQKERYQSFEALFVHCIGLHCRACRCLTDTYRVSCPAV